MLLLALALHITAAAFFSIHVVDSRRSLFWVPALFLIPLVASTFYLTAIFLPEVSFERRVRRLVAAGRGRHRAPVPSRRARLSYEELPSLENRLRLAAALLEAGAVDEAVGHYEACLAGPFADDPEVRLGAARAWLKSGQPERAEELLLRMREEGTDRYPEQASLLLAQAAGVTGRSGAARQPDVRIVGRRARGSRLAAETSR